MADNDSREGQRYASPAILDYVNATHVPHDAGLARAYAVPAGIPAIQVGPSDGKLIQLLLRLAHAKKVVEVGTLVGYSAIHMARALPADGHIWSVEYEEKHAAVARANLAAAGVADKVTVLVGAGVEILPMLVDKAPFDAVFIDADKVSYERYGRWAARNLRPGGLLIGDNVFLFGRLLGDGADAVAMRRFHEDAREAFDTACIPTPDGLLVGVKRPPAA